MKTQLKIFFGTSRYIEDDVNKFANKEGLPIKSINLTENSNGALTAAVIFEQDDPSLPVMIAWDPGRDITNELQEGKDV